MSALNRTNGQHRVLLLGPDSSHQDYLHALLEAKGFRLDRAQAMAEARQKWPLLKPDLVLADWSAEELAQLLERIPQPRAAVLMVGDQSCEWSAAAEGLRRAGVEFLARPVLPDELLRKLAAALPTHRPLGRDAGRDAGPAADPVVDPAAVFSSAALPPDLILGTSAAMRPVLEQLRLVAPKDTTVLITGETGTGKERIARAIHFLSRRSQNALVSVNCGGIPATLLEDEFFGHVKGAFTDAHQARVGRFEQADRGAIFLDEIGDLPLELQPKLLRVLQEREIHRVGGTAALRLDVRVVAATNLDLWSRVQEGRFREDLFYRINVFPIHLPPLRERRQDIPLFVAHFLEKFCRRDRLGPKRLHPRAATELMTRVWPGNIRELENAVEMAVIRSRDRAEVDLPDFPAPRAQARAVAAGAGAGSGDFKQLVTQYEKDLILTTLDRTAGNKSRAAQLLGLKRTTLLEKLKKFSPSVDPE